MCICITCIFSFRVLRQAIINALKRWEDNSGLIFLPAEDEENADINILFAIGDHGDNSSFDGPGNFLNNKLAPLFDRHYKYP